MQVSPTYNFAKRESSKCLMQIWVSVALLPDHRPGRRQVAATSPWIKRSAKRAAAAGRPHPVGQPRVLQATRHPGTADRRLPVLRVHQVRHGLQAVRHRPRATLRPVTVGRHRLAVHGPRRVMTTTGPLAPADRAAMIMMIRTGRAVPHREIPGSGLAKPLNRRRETDLMKQPQ